MGWFLALALKPFIGIALLAILYFGSHAVAWLLWQVMPRGRVKDYLFRGWQRGNARASANADQRLLK